MTNKVDLHKFTGQNDFNMWRIKMEALLITQGLGDAIDPVIKSEDTEASSSKTLKQMAEIDKKARSTIILSLGDYVTREVAKEKIVARLWAKLEQLYMTKSLANMLYIKKKMSSLRMIKGAPLDEYMDEFNKVCDELETIDEGLSDESKALLLISSLPKSYEHFMDALLYGRQTLSLEEVKFALGTKKLKDKQDNPECESSEGLMARGISKKRENKGKNQGISKSKKKHLKCFCCHKEGHFKRDCPERKSKQKEPKDKSGNAAIATEETSFETTEVLVATKEKPQGQWVLDSGCAFHMSPNRSYFTRYQSCDAGIVLMRNNSVCKVVGIGTVSLKMYDGMVRELTQVRHVPELKRNLISIGMLDQIDCVIKAEKKILKVVKGSIVIMKGTKLNGLYSLNGQTTVGEASVTKNSEDKARLWHLRLGHMRKASRLKFESAVHSTKEKLAYIHSDLWGPAQVNSLGGCRSPSTAIECKTHVELWFGRVADYSKLRIFGCMACAHVKQGKLKPRALKCRFLGYLDGVKGYRLWCIDLKPPKCIISRDVTFNESEILNKSKTTESEEYKSEIRPWSVQFEVESHEKENTELVTKEDAGSVTDGFDDVQGSESTESEGDSYQLVRDRKIRAIRPPKRFKARLVARGFTQREGVHFNEIFSPVVKHASIRVILALVIIQDMYLKQMDIKTTFLHGELQEEIVMEQLEGYVVSGKEDHMDVKTTFLHGELQEEIVMEQLEGYVVSGKEDHCPQIDAEQDKMASLPYSSAVGSLMYVMVLPRPDISHVVSVVSRFMSNPGHEHWRAVQWIMRYLKGTMEFGLLYGGLKREGHKLVGYVDSNFAGDLDKRRSQTRNLQFLTKLQREGKKADKSS
ncbi:hypothetical protein KPL71_023512 [Citrus sinensis]|uniref:Uncharacterized protein n=1 Tax=Citrus sinensis TaxID=2711 RepID=A0ACB8IJK6_CITSI|nr:hypothetical protein KPL71_023512 [Citrus sinensis]